MWTRRLIQLPLWILIAFFAIMVITVPLDLRQQALFALGIVVSVFILNRQKSRRTTLVIGVVAMIVSTRYIGARRRRWSSTQRLKWSLVAVCIWPNFTHG